MAWYNASWGYRVAVTIQSSEIDADLSDYPIYVKLSDLPAGFHSHVNADGSDIRVTKSDEETEVAREVVVYSSGNGGLFFLAAGTNSVSSSSDTTFYIYYGNSGASDYAVDATYGAENVWETDGNFQAVYHLHGSAVDSTANDYDMSATGTPDHSGSGTLEFNCVDFDAGSSEYYSITDANSALIKSAGQFTAQGLYYDNTGNHYNAILSKDDWTVDRGFGVEDNRDDDKLFINRFYSSSSYNQRKHGSTTTTATWYFVLARDDNSSLLKGETDGTAWGGSGYNASSYEATSDVFLGMWASWANYPDCKLQEVRYSDTYRSDAWVKADRINFATPTTFYTVGSQEEAPAAGIAASRRSIQAS